MGLGCISNANATRIAGFTFVAASPESWRLLASPERSLAAARPSWRLTVESCRTTCRAKTVAMTSVCTWVCYATTNEFRASLAHVPDKIRVLLLQGAGSTSWQPRHDHRILQVRVALRSTHCDVPFSTSRAKEFTWLSCPVGRVRHIRGMPAVK